MPNMASRRLSKSHEANGRGGYRGMSHGLVSNLLCQGDHAPGRALTPMLRERPVVLDVTRTRMKSVVMCFLDTLSLKK